MYGFGVFVHIINILPFAYVLLLPFNSRRNHILGFTASGSRLGMYRSFWVKLLFGRYQVYLLSAVGSFVATKKYTASRKSKAYYYNFTAFTSEQGGEFDEEESKYAKNALHAYKFNKLYENYANKIKAERAKLAYENKAKYFDKVILELDSKF